MASFSASGITSNPSSSSSKIVPQSVRADGSIRKERKVKPGFTPTEDIAKFRSRRLLQEDERRAQAAAASGSRVGGGEEDELVSGLEKMGIRNHGNYSSSLATATKRELRPPRSYETTKTGGADRTDRIATSNSGDVGSSTNGRAARDTTLASSSSSRIQTDAATSSRSIHAPSGRSNNNSAFAKALRDATSTRSPRPSPSSASSTSSKAQRPQSTPHSQSEATNQKNSKPQNSAPPPSSSSAAVSTPDAWDEEDSESIPKAASADGSKETAAEPRVAAQTAAGEVDNEKLAKAKTDESNGRSEDITLQQLDDSIKE